MMTIDDLVNSLEMIKGSMRCWIIGMEGTIRAIEKQQKELIHLYELTKRVAPNCNSDPIQVFIPEDP